MAVRDLSCLRLGRLKPRAAVRRGGLLLLAVAFSVSACEGGSSEQLGLWPEDYVLTEGPATAGFAGAPGDAEDADSADDPASDARFAACLEVPQADVSYEPLATATGLTFTVDADTYGDISSTAEVVTPAQAAKYRALMGNPRLADCLAALFQEGADETPSEEGVEVTAGESEMLPPPDGAVGYNRLSAQVVTEGVAVDMAVDTLFFAEGVVQTVVIYTNMEPEPPMDRLQLIADQIAGKLKKQEPRSIADRPKDAVPGVHAAGRLGA